MPSQIWTEQLIAHLTLARDVARHCPAGELLDPKELNKVLELLAETRMFFLLICQLNGFEPEK